MDTTVFLAQFWGPVLLAVGSGFFVSRAYYVRVYRDLDKAPFAVLFFGMFAIALGVGHVLLHNVWGTLSEIIVSLLGWGLLFKGLVCTVTPKLADRGGHVALGVGVVPVAGAFCLLIGAYLAWLAYVV